MVDMALERVKPEDEKRVAEFTALKEQIVQARDAELARRRRKASEEYYHFGKLPLELATAIFASVLEDDPAFVVVLAGVCRPWRDAVLAVPTFWRTLVLSTKEPALVAAGCSGPPE